MLCITTAAFAQSADSQDRSVLQLGIDSERTISTMFANRISAADNITVTVQGTAVANGLITWDVTEASGITCNDTSTACNISMPARSSKQLFFTLEGAMVGQGDLVIEGTSRTTQLSTTDTIRVSTLPRTPEGEVKEAPGLMPAHILAIVLLASLITIVRRSQG